MEDFTSRPSYRCSGTVFSIRTHAHSLHVSLKIHACSSLPFGCMSAHPSSQNALRSFALNRRSMSPCRDEGHVSERQPLDRPPRGQMMTHMWPSDPYAWSLVPSSSVVMCASVREANGFELIYPGFIRHSITWQTLLPEQCSILSSASS